MKLKILIVGQNGYLGSYLHHYLRVDAVSGREFKSTLFDENYDYVINCAGIPDVIYCENNTIESAYANCNIISDIICKFPKAKILNFSSYYVYNHDGMCDENSNTSDKLTYCKHKLTSEKITTDSGGAVFRLGKLFGHFDLHKQRKFTEHVILSNNIVADSVCFNPTSLLQVLRVIQYELAHRCLFGIFNLSNRGIISHFNWANLINQKLCANKSIEICDRFHNFENYGKFTMSTDKIEQYIKLNTYNDDLEAYLWRLQSKI